MLKFLLALALTTAGATAAVAEPGSSDCPYLPQFTRLMRQLHGMAPAAALRLLYRYAAAQENENPVSCEGIEIDRLMNNAETRLVWPVHGTTRLRARLSYRCAAIDAGTTACNGVVSDDAAHPYSAGMQPLHLARPLTVRIESAIVGAHLEAVYRAPLSGLLDGKAAIRLGGGAVPIALEPGQAPFALIAIFDAPPPWRYRKMLWYFD